jgi:3-oxoacyl-(acyl-carrier-protein) synthase
VTAVITGLGVVAPTGIGVPDWWRATVRGASGLGPVTRFDAAGYPVRVVGEVPADPASTVDRRIAAQTDRWTHFALQAAEEALGSSGLPLDGGFEVGVTTSASSGGNAFGQREIEALWSRGPAHVGPFQSIAWFYAASTGQLSIRHRLRGPCAVVSAEGAGGLDALAHARRAIRRGARAILVGGTEAPISPYALTCQLPSGLLSTVDDPATAYRPFAADAAGYVPGEGGALAVLEDGAAARERGAGVLAEVSGHAATFAGGGFGASTPALSAAIRGALADAGIGPSDVDAVFADAVGTRAADDAEIAALDGVLGSPVPVTAPKAGTGRTYSAGGSLDVAAAALAIRDQLIPPTPNAATADLGTGVDLVTGARPARLRHVLVLARGFGGFASALVLSRPDPN